MEPDARGKDWRVRWQTDRESVSVAAVEWATALVAAGVPPLLVLEALAHATRAVERGVEVKAATVIDSLEARERTG
jgi:hypothetical protein